MAAFDIDFYTGSKDELLDAIVAAGQQPYRYIVTPNVNHVVLLERDAELRQAYAEASHRVCDSRVLYPLLKALKVPVQEPIPGSTLTAELLELAERQGWSVSVIGCAASDVEVLRQRYGHVTFHHHNPPFGFIDDAEAVQACVDFVAAHPAELNVLSVGAPRQERLALIIQQSGRARGVGLCVGGSLHFLSGRVPRAPEWIQRLSLEWLYRICQEPKRLTTRYLVDGLRVVPLILKQFRHKQLGGAQQ